MYYLHIKNLTVSLKKGIFRTAFLTNKHKSYQVSSMLLKKNIWEKTWQLHNNCSEFTQSSRFLKMLNANMVILSNFSTYLLKQRIKNTDPNCFCLQ